MRGSSQTVKQLVRVQEPSAHFEQWVAKARSGDRLLLVLDPERYLDLGDELQVGGQTWRVYHYAENDLAFRAAYGSGPADPNLCHIVWVTPSPFQRALSPQINLGFIPDVLRRAGQILNLSLEGLLKALRPREVFPSAGLREYSPILSSHLETLLDGYDELRLRIGFQRSLDIHHVRALAIHCLQPGIPIRDLLFERADVRAVLRQYLQLAWSGKFEGRTLALLQEHAAESPPISVDALRPWFQAPPDELALLVYLYRVLRSYRVPNPLNQLRGLGLLTIDPTPLESHLDSAMALWEDEVLGPELLQRAERVLDPEPLADLTALLPFPNLATIGQALQRETAPALTYGLAERFLALALAEDAFEDIGVDVLSAGTGLVDVGTPYTDRAQAALAVIREIAFILNHLCSSFTSTSDLARLVDQYVESGVYRLELACALAEEHIKKLASAELRLGLQAYLKQLRQRTWAYQDQLDAQLAKLVTQDYDAFLGHPRLSIRVLRDTILAPKFRPTQERCVWIVVFDGMRWDSWREYILPALLEHFEIVDEGKAYLSLLPSFTRVARTGLLAGSAPPGWRAADGRHTSNEVILMARLFDLDAAEQDQWLRIEVHSETGTYQQRRLGGAFDRRPINTLVYNISDDWIHTFQGNLAALNGLVAQQVQNAVDDLRRYVHEDDLVVVTSDHGFAELDPEARISVGDKDLGDQEVGGPTSKRVFYRYLVNLEHPDGVRVPFHGEDFYSVAQGRAWFHREKGRFSRYSHGGLSMGEMVVPGLTMRCIVEPCVKLTLSGLPRRLEVTEKEPQTINLILRNVGNRGTEYTLTFSTNTEPEGVTYRGTIRPHEAQELVYTFTPAYSPQATDRLMVNVTYLDVDGREGRMPVRVASVKTEPRQDVVEIDFGGLDQLDEL